VGVNKVISPYLTGGHRAVQAVLKPTVLHFMEAATSSAFKEIQVEELRIEAGSLLAGIALRESRLSEGYGVTVAGVLQPNGVVLNAPTGETLLEPGAILIAIGNRQNLDRVEHLAASSTIPPYK